MSVRTETRKIREPRAGLAAKDLDFFGYSGGIVTWTLESGSESVVLASPYFSRAVGQGEEILYRDVVSISTDGHVEKTRVILGYLLEEYLGHHHADGEYAKPAKSMVGANVDVVPKEEESELAEKMKSVDFYDFTKMENVQLKSDLKAKLAESVGDAIQYLFG
jgi:hypothetical protein